MRFLLDESADARLVAYLQAQGHDVTRLVTDYPRGMADPSVLVTAWNEQRVLITNDRDFGDLVIHQQQPHAGVILFRLGDGASLVTKIERLEHVLMNFADKLDQDHYLVVTRDRVRVRRSDEPS